MQTKIAVIDDDAQVLELIKSFLTGQGFKVAAYPSAESAVNAFQQSAPDLLITDVNLPGFSGIQLCELLRRNPKLCGLPILMLSAGGRETQKVHGLQSGADDYVTKPFSIREIGARVEALLRRATRNVGPQESEAECGGISMSPATHEVKVKGKTVHLSPKEYALLELFMKSKGRVLTHSIIADAVWGDDRLATKEDVKWWIHRLRDKLGAAGGCIETVTNFGYRLAEIREHKV